MAKEVYLIHLVDSFSAENYPIEYLQYTKQIIILLLQLKRNNMALKQKIK